MRRSDESDSTAYQPSSNDNEFSANSPALFRDVRWIDFTIPDEARYERLYDAINALRQAMIELWNQYADWATHTDSIERRHKFAFAAEHGETLLSHLLRSYMANDDAYSLLERPPASESLRGGKEPHQQPSDAMTSDDQYEDGEAFVLTFANILETVYWIPLGLDVHGDVARLEYMPIEGYHWILLDALNAMDFTVLDDGSASWENVRSSPWPLLGDSVKRWTQAGFTSLLLGETATDPSALARLWTVSGDIASQEQDFAQAKTEYEHAIALDPLFLAAWRGLTLAYYHLAEWPAAIISARRMTEIAPDDAANWADLAEMQCNAKHNEAALVSASRAIELDSTSAAAWTVKGWALHRLGQLEESVTACQQALELSNQQMGGAWTTLTGALIDLRRNDEALAASDMAIRLDRSATAWCNRGAALWRLGRYDEALSACERAIARDPESALGWINRGVTLYTLDRFDEALTSHQRASELDPENIKAWFNLALTYRALKRDEDALAACARALALDSTYASAWDLRAITLKRMGRLEEARAASAQAVSLESDSLNHWLNHSEILELLADFTELESASQRLIELDPTRAIGWLRLALALVRTGRPSEAVSAAEHVIELNSKTVIGRTILGEAYSYLGDYARACDAYREAVELGTAHSTPPLGLGWVYEQMDQVDKAVAAYREALRRDPTNEAALHALLNLLTRLGFHDLAAATLAQHTQAPEDDSRGLRLV